MRHYPDLHKAGHADLRREKLFELHRQERLQTGSGRAYGQPQVQRPDVALQLRERANRSLRSVAPDDQPRKPVATTNFSELSEREAGGFTFMTLVKRCFSSF